MKSINPLHKPGVEYTMRLDEARAVARMNGYSIQRRIRLKERDEQCKALFLIVFTKQVYESKLMQMVMEG